MNDCNYFKTFTPELSYHNPLNLSNRLLTRMIPLFCVAWAFDLLIVLMLCRSFFFFLDTGSLPSKTVIFEDDLILIFKNNDINDTHTQPRVSVARVIILSPTVITLTVGVIFNFVFEYQNQVIFNMTVC